MVITVYVLHTAGRIPALSRAPSTLRGNCDGKYWGLGCLEKTWKDFLNIVTGRLCHAIHAVRIKACNVGRLSMSTIIYLSIIVPIILSQSPHCDPRVIVSYICVPVPFFPLFFGTCSSSGQSDSGAVCVGNGVAAEHRPGQKLQLALLGERPAAGDVSHRRLGIGTAVSFQGPTASLTEPPLELLSLATLGGNS